MNEEQRKGLREYADHLKSSKQYLEKRIEESSDRINEEVARREKDLKERDELNARIEAIEESL